MKVYLLPYEECAQIPTSFAIYTSMRNCMGQVWDADHISGSRSWVINEWFFPPEWCIPIIEEYNV